MQDCRHCTVHVHTYTLLPVFGRQRSLQAPNQPPGIQVSACFSSSGLPFLALSIFSLTCTTGTVRTHTHTHTCTHHTHKHTHMHTHAHTAPHKPLLSRATRPLFRSCPSDAEENAALYNMACVYAATGQTASAITCLDAVLSSGERSCMAAYPQQMCRNRSESWCVLVYAPAQKQMATHNVRACA